MTNGTTATLTETLRGGARPDAARRAWPRWLLLGLCMVAVAVVALGWSAAGSRLLLGALGLFLGIRGALLVRRAGSLDAELSARAPRLGAAAVLAGGAALVVAAMSATASGAVLLVVVPLALLSAAAALVVRGGAARRGGQVLLVWAVLAAGLLAATGLGQGEFRAAELAVVIGALAVAVLGVPVLVAAWQLRALAARPVPARPVGCAGCACGAGGCGGLG